MQNDGETFGAVLHHIHNKYYKYKTIFLVMHRTPWWKTPETVGGSLNICNFGLIKS